MRTIDILLQNLRKHYEVDSLRDLAKKIEMPDYVLMNWSSGRSSPKLDQLDKIAYLLSVEVSNLLVQDIEISINSPIWRDNVKGNFIENLGRYSQEKGIYKSWFDENPCGISYWTFRYYINGNNKTVNLNKLDDLAKILGIQTYQLLESRKTDEKENRNKRDA
ncbi:helix-turn-helix domain-containing protein [Streptococcus ruminantium]|uniref:helix-turn-helix domain-containing protein n=1 Tax=Streptococcus ruminantium TaxID=1917441 RepID=UPI0012DF9131|nr:helix-turn-helix domain-containing protein [Streptococcus ruminantium]